MLSISFWPIFFFPYTIGWTQFVPQVVAQVVLITIYCVRCTDFWYRFSGHDRKKLYMVADAQAKFLEYQQRICSEFCFANMNELLSIVAFFCFSSWMKFGWNSEYYPLWR